MMAREEIGPSNKGVAQQKALAETEAPQLIHIPTTPPDSAERALSEAFGQTPAQLSTKITVTTRDVVNPSGQTLFGSCRIFCLFCTVEVCRIVTFLVNLVHIFNAFMCIGQWMHMDVFYTLMGFNLFQSGLIWLLVFVVRSVLIFLLGFIATFYNLKTMMKIVSDQIPNTNRSALSQPDD